MHKIYDIDILGMNHNVIKTISSSYILGLLNVYLDYSLLSGHLINIALLSPLYWNCSYWALLGIIPLVTREHGIKISLWNSLSNYLKNIEAIVHYMTCGVVPEDSLEFSICISLSIQNMCILCNWSVCVWLMDIVIHVTSLLLPPYCLLENTEPYALSTSCKYIAYYGLSCMCAWSCFSHVWFFVTLCAIAHQASLPVGFSTQEYWSGFPCPPPMDLRNQGTEPISLMSHSNGMLVLYH